MNINFFKEEESQKQDFSSIKIGIASPEKIREWSHGEVTKPETLNYRTLKPEKDGLFCERIFGPEKDYECSCGKYKKPRFKGMVCDRCGVELTTSRVRRYRMGHIELAVPVVHIWYFKNLPNKLAKMLDISSKNLERVIYYESYVVLDPGPTDYALGDLITEDEFYDLKEEHGNRFQAGMGGEAIRELLKNLNMKEESVNLRARLKVEKNEQKRKDMLTRLKIVESFLKSTNDPAWMILEALPVLPPSLRPLVPLDGGRFATADLNDLYRRVITRNNRLKQLLDIRAPEVILRNEKRMLQEAVDALFDNSRRTRPVKGRDNRPLKSLSDMLKGKQGRFRQNLLGKRVDYSGRSVIVVGPYLKLHQCGLPKMMALELFKPFIIERLEKRENINSIKKATKYVEKEYPEVWEILEDVIKGHPVLLNRAPTLHRLGIQAFEPVLVEGKAIQLHPLVCTAFNADFDGDQMGVHVPLSFAAQLEARTLMLSSNNILAPASGKPIATPNQDIVLGCYYLTRNVGEAPESEEGLPIFSSPEEVRTYYDAFLFTKRPEVNDEKLLDIHQWVSVRIPGEKKRVITTMGRVIFNSILPKGLGFKNYTFQKGELKKLISEAYAKVGNYKTTVLLDDMKDIGFRFATQAGATFSIDDIKLPLDKAEIIEKAEQDVNKIWDSFRHGRMTEKERYNRVIDIWTRTNDMLTEKMMTELSVDKHGLNPMYMMANSGARGSKDQIRQLGAMRGLMGKPQKKFAGGVGEIIETPIKSSFKEGLSVFEYYISTHGARKGLADTALKTADAGYLTRRLVDVAQNAIISEIDCGTVLGIDIFALKDGEKVIESLSDRLQGRVAAEGVFDPVTGDQLVEPGQEITAEVAQTIEKRGIAKVRIRSALTCETRSGICAKCYGRNLATGRMVEVGEAVGVIAAQSLGEPGTQLTLRTFHIGGTASTEVEKAQVEARYDGEIQYKNVSVIENRFKQKIVTSNNSELILLDKKGNVRDKYKLSYGAALFVEDKQAVEKDDILFSWDNFNTVILTTKTGKVHFRDFVENETYKEEYIEATGHSELIVVESKRKDLNARISIEHEGKELITISMPVGAHIQVKDGQEVIKGDILAKISRAGSKQRDITGSLPRVVELFEARRPKEPSIVTEIDGEVSFGEIKKGKRKVVVRNEYTEREYWIPQGRHLLVHEGDMVFASDPLCDGEIDPHDILAIKGVNAVSKYILNEVQEVYRKQGVSINDKHIGVIIRQMLQKVEIVDPGDTYLLEGEKFNRVDVLEENKNVQAKGGKPATYRPLLLGITKASLMTDSFLSAASFQETTRVLCDAAIEGKEDPLDGLKENVIIGHIIPAGTGNRHYRKRVKQEVSTKYLS